MVNSTFRGALLKSALAVLVAFGASVAWYYADTHSFFTLANWIIIAYCASAIIALPLEMGIFSAIIFSGLLFGLNQINQTKLELTYMPLTATDLKIAYQNPYGLLEAIHLGSWALILLYLLLGCISMVALYLIARTIKTIRNQGFTIITFLASTIIFAFSVFMTWQAGLALSSNIESAPHYNDLWEPHGVAEFSQKLGLIPFLLLSYHEESKDPSQAFIKLSSLDGPSAEEILKYISTYIDIERKNTKPPNIVLIQAESTLNPNVAFRLSRPIHSALFSSQPDTQLIGQLAVNSTGAGSWITEFETITGLDSRIFGYSGYYTHSAVSPLINRTFATYLREYGYQTLAFYSAPGDFYNARRAFKNYGFQSFHDSKDLGIKGWSRSDEDLVSRVVRRLGGRPTMPFFAHVDTNGNHAPHRCENFASKDQLATELVGSTDFEANCQLNEYLLRLQATADAVESMVKYLQTLEDRTGRPYVLLLYGDHQPHTFVAGAPDYPEFSSYRTKVSEYETVFHLRSSVPHRQIRWDGGALPATLVPSILSAFVALTMDDVYLGINFYLLANCGPDFFPGTKPLGINISEGDSRESPAACKKATLAAITYYQRHGHFLGRMTTAVAE